MRRRGFLKSLAMGLGALPLLPAAARGLNDRLEQLAADLESVPGPAELWQRVRREFQLNPGLVHLNCGSLGASPRVVIDAVASALRQLEGNPPINMFGRGDEQLDEVRAQAAEFLGAQLEEMALTRNTTEGMNAVATGLDLQPGDQVLTTSHEHGGGMVCWQHLRRHRGIEIVYIKMPRVLRDRQQILDLVEAHLTPRTKVCSFSHIDTLCGVRFPLAEIAALTRPRGILLVCDGAQVPGMLPLDVKALRVDTYACSGHKWMLGPKGSGLLYIRKQVQDRVHPALLYDGYTGYSASSGTRNVANVVGLRVTLDFHAVIGRERIQARGRQLSTYLRSRLRKIPGIVPLTPEDPQLSGAILTYSLERGDSGQVVSRMLQEHQIVLKHAQPTYAYTTEANLPRENYNAIRFSTHLFNDEAEIDRTVDRLGGLLARA